MSRIKIETLTPVHIGSGNFISNSELVEFQNDDDSYVGIVSPEKILKLVGEYNINNWVTYIENDKSIKEFFKQYAPNATPKDYIKRSVLNFGSGTTLKECLHDGSGKPYIPGSSIKGAIRTAVLASMVDVTKELEKQIDKTNPKKTDRNGNPIKKASATSVENSLFALSKDKAPNSDFFRFIKIGDAYFEKDCEIALKEINLNIRISHDDLTDKSKAQLVEFIAQEETSVFELKIEKKISDWSARQESSVRVKSVPDEIANINMLFYLINCHTKSLLDSEIDYWSNVDKIGADDYISALEQIHEKIDLSDKKTCILRIGHGSGWRFMTGAWTEKLNNFSDLVIPCSRPKNDEKYQEYDFPKSRRIDEDSDVFGFVKLTQL